MKDKAILAILVVICVVVPAYFVLLPVAPTASATVPTAPIKVNMQGMTALVYELEFNDFDRDDLSLTGVRVFSVDNGTLLQDISGSFLNSTFRPRSIPSPTKDQMTNGTFKLLHPRLTIFVSAPTSSSLTALRHDLTFSWKGTDIHVAGPTVQIAESSVPVIISPLLGDRWGACETSIATSHHILTDFTIGGKTFCCQKYAADFLMFASDGSLSTGDGTNNTDYYGYGKELIAVADGVVTCVLDGVPDNTPPIIPSNLTLGQMTGNMVIIDIGGGNYAQYGHMIPGSIAVAVGQHVTAGQVLGLLGNSGNSDAPHLHFQLGTNSTSILASEGLPFLIQNYQANGTIVSVGPNQYAVVPMDPHVMWSDSWYTNMEWIDFGMNS